MPKSNLRVDGDFGLTTRSEAALEPPRFISRMLAGRRARRWYRACTPMALRAWRSSLDGPVRVVVVLRVVPKVV